MNGTVLLVEDDENFRALLETVLADEGYRVLTAATARLGLEILQREPVALVISDMKMPGMSGMELFEETLALPDPPLFIFLTAFGTVEEAVAAMKDGAFDFLTKPLKDIDSLLGMVKRALAARPEKRGCLSRTETDAAGLPPAEIIFAGQAIQTAHSLVHNVASTLASVLITGESGTGKEIVAKTIHLLSPRNKGPFVPVNCAAIPENLLESELFGHEKGAFTGAHQERIGKFELAERGTVFLDEIGDMPLPLQAKLLRVLQEKSFVRVGGTRELKADVRVIAATNRDLKRDVDERLFREDLYYRLNVFPIHHPPLRERRDAIQVLVEYFVRQFSLQLNKKLTGIEPEAAGLIRDYHWPGNIRELRNILERASILASGRIGTDDLPEQIVHHAAREHRPEGRELLKTMERDMIIKALERHGGNRRLTAEELQISRRTLQYKLKEFGLIDEK